MIVPKWLQLPVPNFLVVSSLVAMWNHQRECKNLVVPRLCNCLCPWQLEWTEFCWEFAKTFPWCNLRSQSSQMPNRTCKEWGKKLTCHSSTSTFQVELWMPHLYCWMVLGKWVISFFSVASTQPCWFYGWLVDWLVGLSKTRSPAIVKTIRPKD